MWTDDWIGTPHLRRGRSREGCDCLGLFILLHRARFGREIPDPACSRSAAIRRRVSDAQRSLYAEIPADMAQEGDAILIRLQGQPVHVGYCVDPVFMLHTEDDGGAMLERWRSLKWRSRVLGVFRYAGRAATD